MRSAREASLIRVPAYAKLNLYLHVIGRRADGYHELDSLVAFADLADEVTVSRGDGLSLELGGRFAADAGSAEHNLAMRAATMLASAAGVSAGARIRLIKNIPAAAGLGGGSADAAATLRALMQLWRIATHEIDLAALALELGADVPVCLSDRPSFVGGMGERIDAAPGLPEVGLLLVNPGVRLSTDEIFSRWRGAASAPARFTSPPPTAEALAEILADRANDLTSLATALAPVIGEVLAILAGLPGCRLARMTGSGGTCFGLFDDRRAAAAAAERIAGRPAWWVYAGRLRAGADH